MHMGNGLFGIGFVDVENVCCATVRIELTIHGQVEVSDVAILAKDFSKVVLVDILSQLLHDDLGAPPQRAFTSGAAVTIATQTASSGSASVAALTAVSAIATTWAGV